MIRLAPESESSEAAERGTRGHDWAKWILETALEVGDIDPVLKIASGHEDPDNIFEDIEGYCRYVWSDIAANKPKNVRIERKLELSAGEDLFGTADVCYVVPRGSKRFARVIDLKTGRNFVDEKDGAQLPFYAVAMAEEAKRAAGIDVDEAEVTIYQPLAADEDGEIARSLHLDKAQIAEWRERLIAGARVAREMADAPQAEWTLKAGPHCKYCPAMARCLAFADYASAPEIGLDLTSPADIEPPEVTTLSDGQIASVLGVMKHAREFFKAVEKYAVGRAKEGKPVPGWGLESSRGKRRWIKDETAVAEGLKAVGVEPYRQTLRTITEVEKDMKKAKLGKADRWTEKGSGGFKLVSLTDGRTGLTRDQIAALDFSDDLEVDSE